MYITLGQPNILIKDIVNAADDENYQIRLADDTWKVVKSGQELVKQWADERKVIYGMTTGLGELSLKLIPPQFASQLSMNILRSHAAGVGDILPIPIIRAIMLLRINCLSKGYSGISVKTLSTLIDLFNAKIYPRIRSQGSVGASGDLAPLSHLGLAAMGEGDVLYKGESTEAKIALECEGITPIQPGYKEGLAIINGTSGMTAIGAFAVYGGENLLKTAQIATAFSLEVLRAPLRPFEPQGHLLRPYPGQITVAENIRKLLSGSQLIVNDLVLSKELEDQMSGQNIINASKYRQNAYSLRCVPQMLGPVWDAIKYVKNVVQTEINSIDDNPIVLLAEKEIFHGGNFHGQPVAMAMDFLKISLTEIGNISERRFERYINEHLNNGLPAFLTPGEPGLDAGFEGAQYAATSLLAESRALATPNSIQSISANASFQDVVSMGMIAARKALEILKNIEYIVGLEILAATQAADFVGPQLLGPAASTVYKTVRNLIPFMDKDRAIYYDIEVVKEMVESGAILEAAESVVGSLD